MCPGVNSVALVIIISISSFVLWCSWFMWSLLFGGIGIDLVIMGWYAWVRMTLPFFNNLDICIGNQSMKNEVCRSLAEADMSILVTCWAWMTHYFVFLPSNIYTYTYVVTLCE